ncbi:hypothetical protein B6N60_00020 [Richelia sinica FACHB-800]|uniref:Uncharacterized protein n=1 Tax=Richelia sinica FACHB-800 TaxID=1357546 RepID=A0A975Y2Q8_9NOST|nr:hypothetical protein B6N60_00020 [Richelia sinica FACHB-800]
MSFSIDKNKRLVAAREIKHTGIFNRSPGDRSIFTNRNNLFNTIINKFLSPE